MKTELPPPTFSPAALQVLRKRILRRDESGSPVEAPEEMFRRVAWEVAKVERFYGDEESVESTAEGFFRIMNSLEFLPNSPTLVNAGLPSGQLSGCFVLPIEDSVDSIFETLKHTAIIQKTGGGTGFSWSRLRPRDDHIKSTGGSSSGPVSFMQMYDHACQVNRRGGVRAGANMGVMRCDHPDILEFIESKSGGTSLQTFNISVGVTDDFMNAVRSAGDYPLVNPRTRKKVSQLNAREVFDAIVRVAWETGDPGLVFLDAINRRNPTPELGEIEATNPCGEQPLLPYESCNLGSINLSRFVRHGEIEFKRLRDVVRLAVRFLDNVIDVNRFPIPQIEERTKQNRKIGLGVMGFADLLILLDIAYDSQEALTVGKRVMETIAEEARAASTILAEQRGAFPGYEGSVFSGRGEKIRNAARTTVAPTGTISLIAGCSSGIEPVFAISYVRQILGETRGFATHPLFEAAAGPYLNEGIRRKIAETGSVRDLKEIPDSIRRVFATAHDVEPEWHVRVQAAFQEHVDSAVSKTVNLRRDATTEDIARIYLLAHELGCKGITVFRDGSKTEQVLNPGKHSHPRPPGSLICPECAGTMEHASGCVTCLECGYTYCTV